jgi:hypothetical protein
MGSKMTPSRSKNTADFTGSFAIAANRSFQTFYSIKACAAPLMEKGSAKA